MPITKCTGCNTALTTKDLYFTCKHCNTTSCEYCVDIFEDTEGNDEFYCPKCHKQIDEIHNKSLLKA